MGAKRCYAVNVNPDWGPYSVDQEQDFCIYATTKTMTGEAGAMIDVHPTEESACMCVY